jgi:hypothetical protein
MHYMPNTNPPEPAPEIMTTDQVVQFLQLQSSRSVEHLRNRGRLRGIAIGRQYRYRLKDVVALVDELAGEVKAPPRRKRDAV